MSKEELDGNEKPVRKRMHPIPPSKSLPLNSGTRSLEKIAGLYDIDRAPEFQEPIPL
jgi:hypothetical protein